VKKPRPTAHDRDMAAVLLNLPVGKHLVDVIEETGGALLKPEGGCIIRHDGKVITVVPKGQSGFVRVKFA